jgi:DNA-binding transcriptional regulator YhcF (GntR family)
MAQEGLTLLVDWRDAEPVYAQIARQIRSRVATGEIAPGTMLPPVRSVATDLGVNLNTVARAYRVLEEEGFLRIQHRSGAEVVAPKRGSGDRGRADRLRDDLSATLAQLRQSGVGTAELRRLVEREIDALSGRR